jgi:hypothetical protein
MDKTNKNGNGPAGIFDSPVIVKPKPRKENALINERL